MIIQLRTTYTGLQNQVKEYKKWLIFGADSGGIIVLKDKIVSQIRKLQNQSLSVSKFEYTEVMKNPEILHSELHVPSLFADFNDKIIVISDLPDSVDKQFITTINEYEGNNYIITLSHELKKSSKTRIVFEKNQAAAAVNCYKMDHKDALKHIINMLDARNIQYNVAVPQLLMHLLPNDLLIMQNEIDKLQFLNQSTDKISESEVLGLLGNEADLYAGEIVGFALSQDKSGLAKALETNKYNNINEITLLRVAQKYLCYILSFHDEYKVSRNNDAAMLKRRIPFYGANKSIFLKACSTLNPTQCANILRHIIQKERSIKSGKAHANLNSTHFILFELYDAITT